MRDRAFGLLAILFAANEAYDEGLGGKNLTIRLVLAVGFAIALGFYVFCEGRQMKKGESREGGGDESRMGTGAFSVMVISLDFGDGSFVRHVFFGVVFAVLFGMLFYYYFAFRRHRRKVVRERDGEGRPDKVVFVMGIVVLLLTGFNFATGVYGNNFMLPCIFFGGLGVSMCLEYILDAGRGEGCQGALGVKRVEGRSDGGADMKTP
jgi:hypothetical protein